ncbi:MAG: Rieske 2Fe-2S domain-containing protein [Kofleriaceae bacterium]
MALRVRVCKVSEVIAGEPCAFTVEGVTWPVIVAIVEGKLVAFPGVCPHEDVGLADGRLDGREIVCMGHGWAFDLHTGRCRHAPWLELRRYPITLVGDEVFVDLL